MIVAIKNMISDLPTSEVIHRFYNFGEDVFRLLRDSCSLRILEIDTTTNSFVVRVRHR